VFFIETKNEELIAVVVRVIIRCYRHIESAVKVILSCTVLCAMEP